MKNPSLEPDKDKWEIQRGGNFDGLRTPLRPTGRESGRDS